MRILMASHHLPPRHHGGVEVHTLRLARALRAAGEEVTLVATDDDPRLTTGSVRRRQIDDIPVLEIGHARVATAAGDTLGNPDVLEAFERIVEEVQPEAAHFQHVMYLGLDAPRLVRARGVPTVLTLHEYWLLCGRGGQLRMADGTLCERAVPEICARCLPSYRFGRTSVEVRVARFTEGLRRFTGWDAFPLLKRLRGRADAAAAPTAGEVRDMLAFLEQRRAAVNSLRESLDRVLCPSRFLLERFAAHGWPREDLVHWPNGVPLAGRLPVQEEDSESFSPPLRVGFMGSVTVQKGLQILTRAHALMRRGSVEIHIHGNVRFDPPYWSSVRRDLVASETCLHGAFAPGRVDEAFETVDVLVVPSIWYENAPLVISEAHARGIPVLASRLGGMEEMVDDGVDGILFEPGDSEDLARALGSLAEDAERLARLRRGCQQPRSLEDDVEGLRELYGRLAESVT